MASSNGFGAVDFPVSFDEFFDRSNAALDLMSGLSEDAGAAAVAYWEQRKSSAFTDLVVNIGLLAVLMAVLIASMAFVRRRIVRPLHAFRDAVSKLANGEHVALPGVDRSDEIGALARSMGEIHERGVEAARIRVALDSSSSMTMLADTEFNIVYLNAPLSTLLAEAERDIRAELPQFDASKLLGANIDIFHKNPSHQRQMIEALKGTHHARLKLGGRSFTLAVSPVVDERGERLGTVVEWRDMTAELRATEEIDAVVSAALEGDFSRRADLTGAPDVLREMGERLNEVAGSVEAGVAETKRVVSAMAEGDLQQRMSGEFKGAFSELQVGVNDTMNRMSDLVAQIASSTSSVLKGAGEIRTGADDLSARAEQQASSLEETAATMEEMSASIKSNADSSTNARSLASDASVRADSGGEIVRAAVSAMNEIEASATKIADIISVIDGIAFQTNLLALNAAVEAARAGDAGKGFAVVASEVRALAQRSSEASRDIRQLIETSAGQVTEGVKLVTETGSSLEGIVASIGQVAEAISSIAEASKEQASGVEEISASVSHMDQMTQQNAAIAEQSASNARTLTEGAQKLQELIAFFKSTADSLEIAEDEGWRSIEVANNADQRPKAASGAAAGGWAEF